MSGPHLFLSGVGAGDSEGSLARLSELQLFLSDFFSSQRTHHSVRKTGTWGRRGRAPNVSFLRVSFFPLKQYEMGNLSTPWPTAPKRDRSLPHPREIVPSFSNGIVVFSWRAGGGRIWQPQETVLMVTTGGNPGVEAWDAGELSVVHRTPHHNQEISG